MLLRSNSLKKITILKASFIDAFFWFALHVNISNGLQYIRVAQSEGRQMRSQVRCWQRQGVKEGLAS